MTELRTTRPSVNRFLNGFGLGCVLVLGLGCGRQSREAIDAAENGANATDRPLMSRLPPPRCEWIDYSPKDRKLTLYDLSASGRWMVKPSEHAPAYPVGPEHILPEGLDPNDTEVFYVRPGGQVSRSVTLAQIRDAGRDHVSIAR
jgi:hypothetical protein